MIAPSAMLEIPRWEVLAEGKPATYRIGLPIAQSSVDGAWQLFSHYANDGTRVVHIPGHTFNEVCRVFGGESGFQLRIFCIAFTFEQPWHLTGRLQGYRPTRRGIWCGNLF